MSYHERNIVTYLITGIIVMTIYSFHMYEQFQLGLLDGPEAGTQIGWSAIKLIVGSIIVTIIVSVLVSIANAIITQETDYDKADERDKLIDLIGMKVGFITFSVCFVAGIIWLARGAPMQFILLGFIYAMFVASLIEGATRLVLYRRGF